MSRSPNASQTWDPLLLLAAASLVVMSGVAMASAASTVNNALVLRHIVWTVVGMLLAVVIGRTNYRRWSGSVGIAYGVSLSALALVLLAGVVRLGATRWLSVLGVSVQPSEFAKLATAWLLARYLTDQSSPLPTPVVWWSLALVGPPTLLIFIQPDLGSATVFLAIWLGILWVAGISRRALVGLGGMAAVLAPIGWQVLKSYQRDRLFAFINPHADPLGAGFSIIQSTIAIGSGQLFGRGWFAGTQNQLSFLPERHSDFIFSVIGEEWGFFGCLLVVVMFGILLSRMLTIALQTSDPQGRLLAVGIFSWIGFQAVVNMGMVMGLLPVVGVPLPLISYGGSSMVIVWMALGLLQSIRRMEASD